MPAVSIPSSHGAGSLWYWQELPSGRFCGRWILGCRILQGCRQLHSQAGHLSEGVWGKKKMFSWRIHLLKWVDVVPPARHGQCLCVWMGFPAKVVRFRAFSSTLFPLKTLLAGCWANVNRSLWVKKEFGTENMYSCNWKLLTENRVSKLWGHRNKRHDY